VRGNFQSVLAPVSLQDLIGVDAQIYERRESHELELSTLRDYLPLNGFTDIRTEPIYV
jgi:hypothetical protein